MELKTVIRVHGVVGNMIEAGMLPLLGDPTKLIENNKDEAINEIFADDWQIVDMEVYLENGVLYDIIYFLRELDKDKAAPVSNYVDSDDGDIDTFLRGLNNNKK